jgi:hypothetical protein
MHTIKVRTIMKTMTVNLWQTEHSEYSIYTIYTSLVSLTGKYINEH